MKITINIDCTPEEARRYMGLPDLAAIQEDILNELKEKAMANIGAMQSSEIMKACMPFGVENWLEFQKAFWSKMTSSSGGSAEDK